MLYPLFLELAGAPVLVVGGGRVAARKVASLLHAGAEVTVVSPEFVSTLQRMARRRGAPRLLRRRFRAGDTRKMQLVFAATDDLDVNREIAGVCRNSGIPVNVAAPPDAGTFQVPATIRRGPLCVAISTGGASAHLARIWRERLERLIGPEWARLARLLASKRRRVLTANFDPEKRRRLLIALAQPKFARLIKSEGVPAASAAMDALIRLFCKEVRR